MKIVAVTACPTGIAHTYMAAEALERAAKQAGHEIKVETQGAMGIENELSRDDVARADVVVIAADIEIEKRERFDRIKTVQMPVQEAIKNAAAVIARLA